MRQYAQKRFGVSAAELSGAAYTPCCTVYCSAFRWNNILFGEEGKPKPSQEVQERCSAVVRSEPFLGLMPNVEMQHP